MNTEKFDPNGVGIHNGRFISLPYTEKDAKIVMISVPWDATVSFADGTSKGPDNILNASVQLDLYQEEIPHAWKTGIYMRPPNSGWLKVNESLRANARAYIHFLENGGKLQEAPGMQAILDNINQACGNLNKMVYEQSLQILDEGKIPAVVGGEHSSPLGLIQALNERVGDFGILQIDAHMDLRQAYEGFEYSHASIFYNVLTKGYTKQLTQVAVRDFCEAEVAFAREYGVRVFTDRQLKEATYQGKNWHDQCEEIISALPEKVYLSFDIDGLTPHLCPHTGTPVPGGLEYAEAIYLIQQLAKSGRKIIGFDLCEVGGGSEWDGNVGARVLYDLCCWTGMG